MDNSFLSAQNIDNIYEYINAEMVKSHNLNLDSDNKNKKIVKKLTKTVFDKLQKDFVNSGVNKTVSVNGFNDMVIKKCVPFLLNKTAVKDSTNKLEKKSQKKFSVKKNMGIKNINLDIGEHSNVRKPSGYQSYINDAEDFEQLVKESNRQINDSFKAYSEKKSVFNSHDSITDSCSSNKLNNSSDFIIDRCAIKDDINTGKLDKNAFVDVMAAREKLKNEESETNPTISSQNSMSTGSYDNYDQMHVRDLISTVLINQKDHSSNELNSYEGELYLPNLIKEVGEEAPIQPLLYQNTKQGIERFASRSIIIDSGDSSKLDLTGTGSPLSVTNLATNEWSKFRVNLQQKFKIEKLCDVYIRNFTIIGATTIPNCLYFVVKIDEFNTLKPSNNKNMKDKIIFRNTNTTDAGNTDIVSHTYPFRSFYVASTNPQTFYNLTIELTNENGDSANSTTPNNNTFKNATATTNRVILELEFIPRENPNEIIFDRTPYGSALNAELSNT
jgi:hypothetical protein